MKQTSPQNKARTEAFPRHEPLPSPPDARHGLERVKTGHEINLNRHFHKTEPMQALWWCFQVCVELPTPKRDQIEKWFRRFAETGEFGSDVLHRAVLEHPPVKASVASRRRHWEGRFKPEQAGLVGESGREVEK